MKREPADHAIAEVYEDLGLDQGYWTAEPIADAERRMAIDRRWAALRRRR